ncbi:MAG TPA: hypothetical protein VEQ10_17060, partial [Vicinamibacteria bacterium]|nr:hypothetical protein [Vicinamibacteria bacterium]
MVYWRTVTRLPSLPFAYELWKSLRAGGPRRGLLALTLMAVLLAGLAGLWLRGGLGGPNIEVLRAYQPGKASRLLDRDG